MQMQKDELGDVRMKAQELKCGCIMVFGIFRLKAVVTCKTHEGVLEYLMETLTR